MTVPDQSVELQLSELRRTLEVGLTKVEGQLALLLHRTDQSEQRLKQHEERMDGLHSRIDRVEDRPAVSPRMLVTLFGLLITAIGAATTVLGLMPR